MANCWCQQGCGRQPAVTTFAEIVLFELADLSLPSLDSFSDFQEIVQRTYTMPGKLECQMADRRTFRSVWMVKYL